MNDFSEKIVSDAIRDYWIQCGVCDVIVLFEQKYAHEHDWEECAEFASPYSDAGPPVCFSNDFCEGQTDVRNIKIIRFDEVAELLRILIKKVGEGK